MADESVKADVEATADPTKVPAPQPPPSPAVPGAADDAAAGEQANEGGAAAEANGQAEAARALFAPRGAFKFADEKKPGFDVYNIVPIEKKQLIPEDQARLQDDIYKTRGILKQLREQGVLGPFTKDEEPAIAKEFSDRLKEIAGVGLVGWAQVGQATLAINSIRNELLARKGRSVVYRYLLNLAAVGTIGIAFGGAIELLAGCVKGFDVRGYGNVLMGAMVGAWLSAAANRRDATLDMLPEFLASNSEPAIRMGFVAALAWVAAAFVQQDVIAFTLGKVSFANFATAPKLAFVLGVIAGIGERALSVRLINRASEFVAK